MDKAHVLRDIPKMPGTTQLQPHLEPLILGIPPLYGFTLYYKFWNTVTALISASYDLLFYFGEGKKDTEEKDQEATKPRTSQTNMHMKFWAKLIYSQIHVEVLIVSDQVM